MAALPKLLKFVVLDIDGVLLRGGSVISGAAAAVQKLTEHKIPYVFVTNGGGVKESKKAADLTKKIGIPVDASQVVLSHTPLKGLQDKYANSRVLVIGGHPQCLEVAKSYGFTKAVTIHDIHAEERHIYPLRHAHETVETSAAEAVEAVMVFHDPVDWGLEMQIMSDVLSPSYVSCANNPENKQRGHIPLYVSNADLVYTTEYSIPRFTQGAFATAFKHLYETYHQQPLNIDFCGKPYKVQYDYAKQVLEQEHFRLRELAGIADMISNDDDNSAEPTPNEVFFGVGDNPRSDIRGANSAGDNWRSILVRTGVFNDRTAENDVVDPAHYVCEDITAAVQIIVDYSQDN